MSVTPYLEYNAEIGERVFIAEGARIIGRAQLADDVSIWFNSVVRADVNSIVIGKNTNVQDLCMFHVTEINGLTIGENTSFGHSVVLHGCKIGNGCLIGMGSIILDGAEIGDNCLVAAGSLVSPGKKFPAGSLIKGRPAVVERPLSPEEIERVSNHYQSYLVYKDQYLGMETISEKKKDLINELKAFARRLGHHNLFLLSSSIAYYAALGIAPLLLILLSLASYIKDDLQSLIVKQVTLIAPEVGGTLVMIFRNLHGRIDLSSITGLLGLGVLLFLASLVFTQMRYSLDVIYGTHDAQKKQTLWQFVLERGKIMMVVIVMCLLFTASLLINPLFKYLMTLEKSGLGNKFFLQYAITYAILFVMFLGIYYFTPTRKKRLKDCAQVSLLTSGAFILGNYLTGLYMKNIAMTSLYGAAGALLVFLLWAFYSSLTVFLSVEIFEFFKLRKR